MRKSGFTLLEMSIVIVIIGLIVGGVVLGQSLVRQAQIRSALSEYDRYGKAIKEFMDKYQALPGDMQTATYQWGSMTASQCNASTAITTLSTGTATCNGDGNGKITVNTGVSMEYYTVWQHLSNAGLIDGRYTGGIYSTPSGEGFGYNFPASKLNGAGWSIFYQGTIATPGSFYPDSYNHILMLGGPSGGAFYLNNPVLTPSETLDIDKKIDDGAAGTGMIRTWRNDSTPNCTINDTSALAQTYNTAYPGPACAIYFLLGI